MSRVQKLTSFDSLPDLHPAPPLDTRLVSSVLVAKPASTDPLNDEIYEHLAKFFMKISDADSAPRDIGNEFEREKLRVKIHKFVSRMQGKSKGLCSPTMRVGYTTMKQVQSRELRDLLRSVETRLPLRADQKL